MKSTNPAITERVRMVTASRRPDSKKYDGLELSTAMTRHSTVKGTRRKNRYSVASPSEYRRNMGDTAPAQAAATPTLPLNILRPRTLTTAGKSDATRA